MLCGLLTVPKNIGSYKLILFYHSISNIIVFKYCACKVPNKITITYVDILILSFHKFHFDYGIYLLDFFILVGFMATIWLNKLFQKFCKHF